MTEIATISHLHLTLKSHQNPSCAPSCANKFIPTCPRIGYKVYTQNIFITNKNKQCQRKKKLYIYTIHFNVVTAD